MIKKRATIINLFGGPGCSKSTIAAGVFSLLKLHGVNCELVTEYAKRLVWEERFKTFKNQQYLFAKQYHGIWTASDKVDFIITDCPLMLNIVYNKLYGESPTECLDSNVVDVVNRFNNYNIFLKRFKSYVTIGRNETEEEALNIDNMVKDTLNAYSMDFEEIDGNFMGINKLVSSILNKLDVEQKFDINMMIS